MSKFNNDIVFLLFEELQSDSKSLFSCLLVNRLWCKAAIPILWRNPWCYKNIDYQKKGSLYHIITIFLPDDVNKLRESNRFQFHVNHFHWIIYHFIMNSQKQWNQELILPWRCFISYMYYSNSANASCI